MLTKLAEIYFIKAREILRKREQMKLKGTGRRQIAFHLAIVSLILACFGISQFRSYGISYDEPAMRMQGIGNAKYIANIFAPTFANKLNSDPLYESVPDLMSADPLGRTHPAFFEIALVFMEYKLNLTHDKKNLWEYRHLATYIFSSIGIIAFFVFLFWRFRKLSLAYLGICLILFSPRISADMFYNEKDLIFLTTYLFAGTSSVAYIITRRKSLLFLSAAAAGLSTATRQIGIIPALLVWVSIIFLFKDSNVIGRIRLLLPHVLLTLFSTILFVPYFWGNPLPRLMESFVRASSFPYSGCTLTWGSCLPNLALPWYYLPVWMAVTIPIGFLIIFVVGVCRVFIGFVTYREDRTIKSHNLKIDILVLLLVIAPLFLAVALGATLYNGWRHFYFVYPFLSYFGVRGIMKFNHNSWKKFHLLVTLITIVSMISTAMWMNATRPLGNLYFNQLAGKEVEKNWVVDYFSLSNRLALEWIVSGDSRAQISIQTTDNSPVYDNAFFLSDYDKSRLNFLWFSEGIEKADYVIARQDLTSDSRKLRESLGSSSSGFQLMYRKIVGQAEVFSIYKRRL